jgi:hypothetical protein
VTPDSERALADAVGDERSSKHDVLAALAAAEEGGPCADRQRWGSLARDSRLEAWRRLAACHVLLTRCVTYPRQLAAFIDDDLAALGARRGDVTDASMAQNLPLERRPDEQLFVVSVPIDTSVGRAAIYFAVGRGGEHVTGAAIYPPSD